MLEGLVLVVSHETLNNHLVCLYVHVVPAVGQCGIATLNRYPGPFAIVDGKFALVVRQGFAVGQHLQKSRLAVGHHAIGEELRSKVKVVCSRLIHGTVKSQIAVLRILLHLRTEILQGITRIDAYATTVLLRHGWHSGTEEKAGKEHFL